jgi:hypothetical protein
MTDPKSKRSVTDENQPPTESGGGGSPTTDAPDRERIARRAYERFQTRGGEGGRDQEDWFEAERELNGGPGQPERE